MTRVLLFVNGPVRWELWAMVYCGGPVNFLRPALYVWYRTTKRSAFIHPDNLPLLVSRRPEIPPGFRGGLVPGSVRVLPVEAES